LSNPSLSLITFVPGKGQPAKTSFRYTAYTANGDAYNGRIVITPASAGKLKSLSYMSFSGEPFGFGDSGVDGDITAQFGLSQKQTPREPLSYVIFKLPSASTGKLYTAYTGDPSKRKTAADGEKIYAGGYPSIYGLAFVAEKAGNVSLEYTAFSTSGLSLEGKITIKQTILPDGWSRAEIGSLAKRGVVPARLLADYGKPITRAELTALFVKVFDYYANTERKSTAAGNAAAEGRPAARNAAVFKDTAGNPYARIIARGYALRIIDGISETEFDPDSPVTREAAAKILCSAVSLMSGGAVGTGDGMTPPYRDIDRVSLWAAPYVTYAYRQELMAGDAEGLFRPQDGVSREEAMALAERILVKFAN
jgi:hypothetical protein